MLIVMRPDATGDQIQDVLRAVEARGFTGQIVAGERQTSIAVTGNKSSIDPGNFENLPGVAEAVRITQPYRLTVKNGKEAGAVPVGNASIGAGSGLALIAGPCAIEDREQVLAAAEAVAASGARFFRGGAFKPRTSPYAFQGLGIDGLKLLADVRDQFGLNIITEAMDEHGVDAVAEYGDCIQIGARNMQNFALLKYVGGAGKPVLLKRGLSATLDELLLAAEYIMAEGNENVILCERGIRTFAGHARNTLDLSIIPAVKRISHLPIIVDPSHGTGHNYLVAPMALAGVAAGADGLIIEVHPHPEQAKCDGAQALTLEQYAELSKDLTRISDVLSTESVAAVV
jgi:3-deoxy-7-phosphoheptulonate synthase